ncbi:MAG TPA: outer membrane beta-barrel protein [Flavisolibacter sp.]|nr:outer membrane beta-barrel protein [Flavisolibacter sp.]
MRFLYCLLLFAALIQGGLKANAQARQVNVRFKLVNAAKEPVPFATLEVISVPDTVRRQQKAADSSGSAVFTLTPDRPYLVRVSSANNQPFEKSLMVRGDNTEYELELKPLTTALNTVVVRAARPLMRQEDDKTIVDPENLAAVSTNAYEILEKTPGLFVDQDGNIYLTSTTPATVYINGREQKMSAADIATMLKNLPPNAIASIEILRTPSARYDASGSGGIVNVVLRKGVRIGLTGSVTAGMNQGRYGNQFLGINLNNNNGLLTTYLNLQYGRRQSYDRLETNRFFSADSLLAQDALTRYKADNLYLGYGLSYQFAKKWEAGYDGRISYNTVDNRSTNLSRIIKLSSSSLAGTNDTRVRNKGSNYNITQGLNLKHRIDSAGSEWTTDLSFTYAPNGTEQTFNTGDGDLDNRLRFFSAQTNLVKKIGRSLTVEAGGKTSLVGFRNSTDYFRLNGNIRETDSVRTGAYRYREYIHAGYVQASKVIRGITFKAGARLEHTDMRGRQIEPDDTSFAIKRTDLFPYVYISKSIMTIAGYDLRAYLVLRRTISRPAYEYLNPTLRFIDPFLFETGNPSLRPQFTWNYEANISVDERPIVAFGVNDTKDIFTQVVYQADTNAKVSLRTYDNLGSNKETYIRLLGAIPPGKRYFFVVGAQYNHNFYNGFYEQKPLSFRRGSWTIFSYHSFRLTPLTQLSMSGFARFKGQQQFYELSTFGEFRASVSQQLFKKKLNLTLSVNDIFRTNRNEFTINQGSINAYGMREADTRRFGLNLRYNFGLRKKEERSMFDVESRE